MDVKTINNSEETTTDLKTLRNIYLEKYESCISQFTQGYTNKIVSRGCKNPYQFEDLYIMNDDLITNKCFPVFLKYYLENRTKKS